MRYAVASDFEGECRYWDGTTQISFVNCELPTVSDRAKAETAETLAEARYFADAATELSRCLPPFKARTWFVVELPEPPR